MKTGCIITGYCCIRENAVSLDGKPIYKFEGKNFGESATGIYKHFKISYPKFHKMDNLGKLGFLTSEILLRDKDLLTRYSGDEVGIILMNSASSLDTDRQHQKTISSREEYFPSPALFVYTLPNVVIGEICIRNKFLGDGNFFVVEKFNPGFLVKYVSHLLDNEIVKCCLTGWIEVDGDKSGSVLFLIEKSGRTETGIANFETAIIETIFNAE